MVLQRFEPVGWAEELLPAATEADLTALPRLYRRPASCALTGRPDAAVGYAQAAAALEADPRYDSFEAGWSLAWEAIGHRYAGRIDRWLEICDVLTAQERARPHSSVSSSRPRCCRASGGRRRPARSPTTRWPPPARRQNPFWIAFALEAYARAYADKDPGLAMDAMDEVLDYTREHRLLFFEANTLREIAALEAVLGDPEQALELFDTAVASYHRGRQPRQRRHHPRPGGRAVQPHRPARDRRDDLRHQHPPRHQHDREPPRGGGAPPQTVLGADAFDRRAATGAAMEFDEAMEYVRGEIALARRQLTGQP